MTRFGRVYVSHNRLEWWYRHLTLALSRHLEVVDCPMTRFSQRGHSVETDVTTLIDGGDRPPSFYLGSADQLFTGISDLPVPSAIWADCLLPTALTLLPCFSLFDVVFSSQKDAVSVLKGAGLKQVEWLPFAFDTTLRNEPGTGKVFDVGFVGSLELPATRAERVEVLDRLERKYQLNDYRTPAFGDDMMRVYNQSRVVVNIPVPGGFNMRTFEALASGALLLTKNVGNGQDDLFKDGTHFVTYRDTGDLIDKIDYFLGHERERQEIACAGMREVLTHHTYEHRAARVLEVMEQASPARVHDRASHVAAYAAFYDYLGRADLLASVAFERGVPLSRRLRLLARAALKFGRMASNVWKRGGVAPERPHASS